MTLAANQGPRLNAQDLETFFIRVPILDPRMPQRKEAGAAHNSHTWPHAPRFGAENELAPACARLA
jgi:hypothetical protein